MWIVIATNIVSGQRLGCALNSSPRAMACLFGISSYEGSIFALESRNMNGDMLAMARRNYGYGRWEAPYWFIGPEQGMGPHENNDLNLRVQAWLGLNRLELNDCREFHRRIWEMRWHFKEPKVNLQPAWRRLMLLMMTFLGRQADNESLRNYQRDKWGALDGETCVIELSGLAAPNLNESKETGRYLQERIEVIRRRIHDHRPELLVMYGRIQRKSWEKIAGSEFPPEPEPFLTCGPTIMVFTPHPVARIRDGKRYLGNEYWTRLGGNFATWRTVLQPPSDQIPKLTLQTLPVSATGRLTPDNGLRTTDHGLLNPCKSSRPSKKPGSGSTSAVQKRGQ